MMARQAKQKVDAPAARPSRPSVRFTALAEATMTTVAQTTHKPVPMWNPIESYRVNDSVVVAWAQYTASNENSTPRPIWAPNLARLLRPRLRRWRTLIQSSAIADQTRADEGQYDQRPRSGEGHPGHGVGGEIADDHCGHDADPAHGGCARLGDVDLGPVLPDLLADVVLQQPTDEERGRKHRHPQGDAAGGHQRDHGRPPSGSGSAGLSARARRASTRSSKGTTPSASTWVVS